MKYIKNVGEKDKLIRVISALVFLAIGHIAKLYILNVVALILLLTAVFGFCGIYAFLGKNTCKSKE